MKNVVWLSSMPRSGSTWLSQIFAASPQARLKFCPLFSYEFKDKLDEKSSSADWRQLFFDVYNTRSPYLDQEYLREKGLIPCFESRDEMPPFLVIKSTRYHNLIPSVLALHETIKFIHVIRDPRAALFSWLNSSFEFPSNACPELEWRSGECRTDRPGEFWGFDAWKAVNKQALELQAKYPDRFAIWSYESLVENTENDIADMFDFVGISMSHEVLNFIKRSQSNHDCHQRSVFKCPTNLVHWRGRLDPRIANVCESEVKGTELEPFLSDRG
jgi:hypothetical protein